MSDVSEASNLVGYFYDCVQMIPLVKTRDPLGTRGQGAALSEKTDEQASDPMSQLPYILIAGTRPGPATPMHTKLHWQRPELQGGFR